MAHWLKVRDDPKYEVSNEGSVRNGETGKILKPQINKPGGYERVRLSGKYYCVHRLVADAFFAGNYDYKIVRHRDGDRHNNHVSNLTYQDINKEGPGHKKKMAVTTCKHCKNRGMYEICMGKSDDFYCGFGDS